MQVSIREVGPRDGLQNEEPVPTAAKVRLLDALSGTGVRRIEAVSFVHPKAIPQMADADEVWAAAPGSPAVRYSALVPNTAGRRSARWRPASARSRWWCRPATRTTGATSTARPPSRWTTSPR